MKVLGIDVGATWGWAFYNTNHKIGFESGYNKTSLEGFGDGIKELLYTYAPDIVVTARPTFRYVVIASQSKKLGLIEYFSSKTNTKYKEYTDSHCKKIVLGKGKATKTEIKKAMGGVIDENEADARMFVATFLKENDYEYE